MTRLVVERPDGRLVVNTYGDPRGRTLPLLFVHPINLRGYAWFRVVAELADERFCVVPDLRGFGDSDTAERYDIRLWAQDCLDAAAAAGVERFHVVGGSLGGAVATFLAAIEPPRVASVLAFGSQLHSDDADSAAVLATLATKSVPDMFADIIPRYSLGPRAGRQVVDEVLATTNPNGADDVRAVWKAAAAADVRSIAPDVVCPITVVTGADDLTCPPQAGKTMAQQLRGDHQILPDCGHLPMFELPDATVDLVRRHLVHAETSAP
ncbi:alpha/beta fold hydrolase [Kribbella sp. NPDC050124]|uniref:alpha/beta fold hydrolase n=1 Tax=Kribbella sp. NPDC050124 TaxID=3364114 RepID=UPI0037B768CF